MPLARLTTEDAPVAHLYEGKLYSLTAMVRTQATAESHFPARNMGKNDLWIAATASAFNLKLATTDKDFQHLEQVFVDLVYVNYEKYR